MLVLSTGGTISSRQSVRGGLVATDGAEQLLSRVSIAGPRASHGAADVATAHPTAHAQNLDIEVQDVLKVLSFLLQPADMLEIARRIRAGLADAAIAGVVVTHGTDTMEETAFLADLVHADSRPVVFTGAQRSADAPDADGPRNLSDAIAVAASDDARGLGAMIVFDGLIFAASGTRKAHTIAPAAFASASGGPIGRVRDGAVIVDASPRRAAPISLDTIDLTDATVDIVPVYPGVSAGALHAVVAAGATGIVLEATGAGNANPEFCREVAQLTARGVVVALSTRVPAGPVTPLYASGGGVDLVAAGAIPIGTLRSSQARMLLLALLGSLRDPALVRSELSRRCGRHS
ncbi:asparaginase [Rathayibacter soli]|uniref:asparaginase n=1 Tax=Rathayibacter soli TaxID=3144168 RepID=UPI0027E59E33|nr:asparaginase [Glaciibacter superstes]